MKDEDYAYGQWKQKQIDDGVLIGRLLADKDKIQRFANKDPHRHVPFVECAPPSPGVTYWLACAVVIGTFAAAVYLGYLK